MEDEKRQRAIGRLAAFVQQFAGQHPGCSKDEVAKATAAEFALRKERSVFEGEHFSLRFSTAKSATFSNVVISLSALAKYDQRPFIICIVRPSGIQLLLANTTLLKKVSHSSHQLRIDNVRGSILGHDIMRSYDDVLNTPENFESLFLLHREFAWDENLARLVEATNAIVATGVRFEPTVEQRERILAAPDLANLLAQRPDYLELQQRLVASVQASRTLILEAARIDNVNLRGNSIEQIVTRAGNFHKAEDISEQLESGTTINIDVKTKLINLGSSPKAYNIDKILKLLANGNTAFAFLFIAIDVSRGAVTPRLVSILDKTILAATRIQFHWAGRASRGVTQLTGDFNSLFLPEFCEKVDVAQAKAFLNGLIEIPPVTPA